MLRFARILAPVALVIGLLFTWWIERDRARHVDRPATAETHVAAARMMLREIQTAQEIHAAERQWRYASSLDSLLPLDGQLGAWLERGVSAVVTGDPTGAWYVAEVRHASLPGWRCVVASDSAPAVLAGRLAAGEHACDPRPAGSD